MVSTRTEELPRWIRRLPNKKKRRGSRRLHPARSLDVLPPKWCHRVQFSSQAPGYHPGFDVVEARRVTMLMAQSVLALHVARSPLEEPPLPVEWFGETNKGDVCFVGLIILQWIAKKMIEMMDVFLLSENAKKTPNRWLNRLRDASGARFSCVPTIACPPAPVCRSRRAPRRVGAREELDSPQG